MTSLLAFGRRCHPASSVFLLASSLDFLQGTFEKIHLHRLLGEHSLQLVDLLTVGRRVRAGPRGIFSRLDCLEFNAPLVQASRVTPSSCANSLTSSQVLRRSTAIRWNFREYRFRFTLQPFPCKVCPSRLSHFKGAVHVQLNASFLARKTVRFRGPFSSPRWGDVKFLLGSESWVCSEACGAH